MVRPLTLADITPEILENVLGFLGPADKAQCQLVCTKWKRVAHEQLYKDVKEFSSVANFNSFMDTISISPSNPGVYVKSLMLYALRYFRNQRGGTNNVELTNDMIAIIGEHCPKYLKSFVAFSNSGVFEGLLSQINLGRFKHLTSIPLPSGTHYLDYANTTDCSFKESYLSSFINSQHQLYVWRVTQSFHTISIQSRNQSATEIIGG